MKHKTHLLLLLLAYLSLFLAGCGAPPETNTAEEPPGSIIEANHEEPPAFDFPVEELEVPETPQGIARASVATPSWLPVWEPPTLRPHTKVVSSISAPKAGAHGWLISRLMVAYTGYWGALVSFDQPHTRISMEDVEINCINGTTNATRSKWTVRFYQWLGRIVRFIGRGAWWEHILYGSYGSLVDGIGELLIQDAWLEDAGAQALQMRHTQNRADPQWSKPRKITLRRVFAVECGQARGIGRAGSAITLFDAGPLTDIVFEKVAVRTINQTATKVYNGKTFDSFGGVCVQFCQSFTWKYGWVQMKNPDRPAIMLFDFGRKEPTRTGPNIIDIEGLHLDSGILAVRVGDGERIDIRNCTGNGWIQAYRWNGSDWKLDPSMTAPIGQGLFWVR